MADQLNKKSSFAALRKWYAKRSRSVARNVQSESQHSTAQIQDFLTYQPGAELRQTVQRRPRLETDRHEEAQRKSQYLEFCHVPTELDCIPARPSVSTISLPSTVATGSRAGVAQQSPQELQSLPRPRPRARPAVEGPEDFEQFRSDLRGRFELESTAAQAQKQPRSQTKSFTIYLPETQLAKEQLHAGSKAKAFRAFSGRPVEKGPEKIQAYPGAPKRKPVGYVPPTLQPGYVDGVPPVLRACHNTTNLALPQNKPSGTGAAIKNYSYPLVDFHQGLFINANLSEASISGRHQDPRIPAMNFTSRGLADEVNAELTRLRVPDEKEVIRPKSKSGVPDGKEVVRPKSRALDEKEVVRPKSRAWMSPGSPLNQNAYELEASAPGFPLMQARAVNLRSQTPRVVRVRKQHELQTPSPVSPLSGDAGKVDFREYNWPRFVDKEWVDPAKGIRAGIDIDAEEF
ncbi:hypothetical protein A1O7_00391 [Cladophialophora yegresii CBS 114405]|uniref:Uncharacterized protein n=1 Tax=Cladophialophora yegresii CBS 114405 TaxID=1182544 RepID=W9WHG2_9EURO|nr:uncharacterized protein A1O7_00391 [Cladophialophora yegresii CBS 114405]EXJ64056.1 hypothetical protein A1O7_00391 [Cladophialophora yegresii CBS 114405]